MFFKAFKLLAACALFPLLMARAQELHEQPTPFSTWLDFQTLGSAHAPRQSLPIWLESVQRTAQPSNTNAPVKTTFRIRLRRVGQVSDQLQLRLFFNDIPGAAPLVSGWSETGTQQFRSQPLGSGLDLATSESLLIASEDLDYIDVSVPGDGSSVRGAFVASLKKSESLHALDFTPPAEFSDPFANLSAIVPSPNDSILYGRVKAVIQAAPILLAPPDAREVAWGIDLDAIPLLAVIAFEVLDIDPLRPPEWVVNGTPLGAVAIHLPDIADPAYQAVVHPLESTPRFQYTGWLRGQQAIPGSALRVGSNKIVLRLHKKSNAVAVRTVEMQLKHHWQHLDYKLAP